MSFKYIKYDTLLCISMLFKYVRLIFRTKRKKKEKNKRKNNYAKGPEINDEKNDLMGRK